LFSDRAGGGNRDWGIFPNPQIRSMIAPWISTLSLDGLPSHITPGRCPYIPSFGLSRGGRRFLLLYGVVALMELIPAAAPCFRCLDLFPSGEKLSFGFS
ncbi:hypothetical protein, partial [Paenibacillus sp. NRS-1781]|uniref:hypothetical protein n=1 Tax=unclassified Paenibacillus TaxID=185978 RepID=UPI003D29DDC6